MSDDQSITGRLRLAADLCIGVAAFFVTPTDVEVAVSPFLGSVDAEARIGVLAVDCLDHPSSRGRAIFWSAENGDRAETVEDALACVVVPAWSGGEWVGLLGVVDFWLPELDAEQRDGVLALAGTLAGRFAPAAGRILPARLPAVYRPDEEPERHSPQMGQQMGPPMGPPAGPPIGPPTRQRVGGTTSAEPFLSEVLDSLPDGLVVTRSDGAVVLVNRTFTAMSGFDVDDLLGEDISVILEPTDATDPQGMDAVLARPEPGRRLTVARSAGPPLTAVGSGTALSSRFAGDCFVTLVRSAGTALDVAASGPGGQGAEIPMQELLDNLDIGIVCCDVSGTVVLANRMARELQGLSGDAPMVGAPFPRSTDLWNEQGERIGRDEHPLFRALRNGSPDSAHLVRGSDEGGIHVAVSARPILVGGRSGAIAVLRDVTAEWEDQVHLAHHAFHDPLTGVANRYLLIETLVRMLHGLSRHGGAVLLVFLDLDQFKRVNDEHGHEVGDQVLIAMARRLQGAVRSDDIVARLGGDEFVVVHVSQEPVPDGDGMVGRLRQALSAPYQLSGLIVDVGVSAGWVSTASSEVTPEHLLSQADDRMYRDKRQRATRTRQPPS